MKKSLIAIAALAATSAFAQSSVTLYGTLDVGYGSFSNQIDGIANSKVTQRGAMNNSFDSSRWGMTAVEDIGGGAKAGLQIESWINGLPRNNFGYSPAGGTATGVKTSFGASDLAVFSNTNSGQSSDATVLGNRLAFVNYINGASEVRIGTQSSFTRDLIVGFQADGSNLVGNLAGNDASLTARYSQIAYLYTGKGFGLGAAVSNAERLQDTKSTVATSAGYHLKGTFEQGPWAGGVAYSKVKSDTNNTSASVGTATTQLNAPTVSGLSFNKADATTKVTAAVASYDLNVAKIYAEYGQVKVSDDLIAASTSQAGTRSTYNMGARMPYGAAGGYLFAQVSKGKIGYNTSGTTYDGDWSGYTIGAKHAMSKRTYAYAGLGQTKYQYSTTNTLKADQLGLGLVHSF